MAQYGQPIMVYSQPVPQTGAPKSSGVHPLILIFIAAIILVAVGSLYYFLGQVIFPLTAGIQNSITTNTPANFTQPARFLTSVEQIEDTFLVVFILFCLFLNMIYSYLRPSKVLGYIDILLIFLVGYIWLMIKVPIIQLAPLLGIITVYPEFYAFFVSNYYIVVTVVFMALSIIFNFTND